MTTEVKEYLEQAYRLDKRIDNELHRIEELRRLSCFPKQIRYGERVQESNIRKDAYFVKILEKRCVLEKRCTEQIDKLIDLKEQMRDTISTIGNIDYELVLEYRYLQGKTWEEIAKKLHINRKTARIWHDRALEMVVMPENPIIF